MYFVEVYKEDMKNWYSALQQSFLPREKIRKRSKSKGHISSCWCHEVETENEWWNKMKQAGLNAVVSLWKLNHFKYGSSLD